MNLYLQAAEFLRMNPHLIIVSSDKGGKTVIMERDEYVRKMELHLTENMNVGTYKKITDADLTTIQKTVESSYLETISHIIPYLKIDGTSTTRITAEPYLIPLLYGCPKIHKADIPMRPIVASADMIGDVLSQWLLGKLQLLASSLDKYNVTNARKILPKLRNFKLEPEHKLCSLDYVSMYTNVDVDETCRIISELYPVISGSTSVPLEIFILNLRFFTNTATYFLYGSNIYKQIKGLAMGNKLAQVLAEIRTNYALHNALKKFDAEIISFFFKYVDDVFAAIHASYIEQVKHEIIVMSNMELTITHENAEQDVEFLDCTFHRNQDLSVAGCWLKKSYSSMSILNYHSYHPRRMKENMVLELIKNAFAVTSPEFFDNTKELLTRLLKNSSYPLPFIADLMNDVLNGPGQEPTNTHFHSSRRFISCPYNKPLMDNLQKIVNNNHLGIKLAPRPTTNNRTLLFTKTKDVRDPATIKNAIFKLCCENCTFTHMSSTKNSDVRRSIMKLLTDASSISKQHLDLYPDHHINPAATIIKTFLSKSDMEHSEFTFNYISAIKEHSFEQ